MDNSGRYGLGPVGDFVQMASLLASDVSFCMARGVREDNKQQRKIMILCKTDLKHDNEERKGEI